MDTFIQIVLQEFVHPSNPDCHKIVMLKYPAFPQSHCYQPISEITHTQTPGVSSLSWSNQGDIFQIQSFSI